MSGYRLPVVVDRWGRVSAVVTPAQRRIAQFYLDMARADLQRRQEHR